MSVHLPTHLEVLGQPYLRQCHPRLRAPQESGVRRDDLSRDTPYNTYTRAGLPPTPIATPGRAAIEAVMHPGAGSALYFVASGGGRHYFSDTLKEHNLAVDKFQRGRKGISLPKESEVK